MSAADQRSEARIRYSEPVKSGFLLGDAALDLLDISESGLRFRQAANSPPLAIGSPLYGIVCLRHGETAPVSGMVVRVDDHEIAARISDMRIPFERVVAERLYLETGRTGLRW